MRSAGARQLPACHYHVERARGTACALYRCLAPMLPDSEGGREICGPKGVVLLNPADPVGRHRDPDLAAMTTSTSGSWSMASSAAVTPFTVQSASTSLGTTRNSPSSRAARLPCGIHHVGSSRRAPAPRGATGSSRSSQRPVDLLLLPYFDWSEETRRVVAETIRPRQIAPMHVPPSDWEDESREFGSPSRTLSRFPRLQTSRATRLPDPTASRLPSDARCHFGDQSTLVMYAAPASTPADESAWWVPTTMSSGERARLAPK